MRHKRLICILLGLALASVLIPSAYAYMVRESQTVANTFTPAEVTCDIKEKFENNVKSSIKVENTGNIDAYIRVRLAFRWEDSKGNPVARNAVFPDVDYDSEKWVKHNDIYYYKEAVAPGEDTGNLLDRIFTEDALRVEEELQGGQKVYYYYYPVMEVFAEAIQSQPKKAVENSWQVEIGTDGKIME